MGRCYVNSAFIKARDSNNEGQFVYTPNVKSIKEFLPSNKYVVTNTDKNLGIVVSKKDWIIQKCPGCLKWLRLQQQQTNTTSLANNFLLVVMHYHAKSAASYHCDKHACTDCEITSEMIMLRKGCLRIMGMQRHGAITVKQWSRDNAYMFQ